MPGPVSATSIVVPLSSWRHAHSDGAAFGGVADRVFEQVAQDVVQACGVGFDAAVFLVDVHMDLGASGLDERRELGDDSRR